MKLVYIGAGSFRFGYGLFKNLVAMAKIIPMEIWLVDINEKLLNWMYRLLVRAVKKYKLEDNLIVKQTTDRREALEHADFVMFSISIGQQVSEWYDIYIPQKFGIPQNTGDTVGPGGIFRTARLIPTKLQMFDDVNEFCPKAGWSGRWQIDPAIEDQF